MNKNNVELNLTRAEAIVLFEFVSRFSEAEELSIEDQAEERVLWDICCSLEKILAEPFEPNWNNILKNARDTVRDVID